MGFKTVYGNLMELFPQVDSRILKAVAIEHPKDADLAADVVMTEVLPYLARRTFVDHKPSSSKSGGRADHEVQTRNDQGAWGKKAAYSLELSMMDEENAFKTDPQSSGSLSNSTHQENALNSAPVVSFDTNIDDQSQENIESEELILLVRPEHQDNVQSATGQTSTCISNAVSCEEITDHIQVCGTTEAEVPASLGKCLDDNIRVGDEYFEAVPTSSAQESDESDGSLTGYQGELKDFDRPLADDLDTCGKSPEVQPRVDGEERARVEPSTDKTGLEVGNFVVQATPDAAEDDFQFELSGTPTNSSKNLKFNQDIKIDFLEDIVEAAKNNKKTLFLAMESIMKMMRHVELQEKAAEEAKEEASSAGLDILTNVDKLKQMLVHAKEANDMHAGEVYGERAILATEVRELQARLLVLSDERDKALAIIDEMQQSLEERLAAAEELRKSAEKQKLEQEEAARAALAEQEAIMEKVVQESKILQQEADENSKLREFLMDRGHVVDTLQGEISVICQDVRLLKERFDERIPLSKSISSSQTSCILASSGSSLKSIASDMVLDPKEISKSPEERSATSSVDGQSPKSLKARSPTSSITGQSPKRSPASSIDGQSPRSRLKDEMINRKVVLDDDWEFFE